MTTATITTLGTVSVVEGERLLRLMQLCSPSLPVGGYAYSHGFEQAVGSGVIHDEASAQRWILGVAQYCVAPLQVPLLARLIRAFHMGDVEAIARWNDFACASRETAELVLEDQQMGRSLARLLDDLGVEGARAFRRGEDTSFVTVFSLACARWELPVREAQQTALFSFCENQVACAMKIVPLGQTAGQRVLVQAMQRIPGWVVEAGALDDDDIGPVGVGLALASARHEQQYSRLFRS